ncbi:hypothetical protein CHS0354_000021 [Potamilus streckersoni]|uniref:THD domain-containing protein n=1 Tax=Potamilus streckersoni TaxID=2493646 RepID=A0AAE0TJ18_9BIVA|nr:hypothetical protein CHS0354_000021 [Potamilus streckersoni]
MHLQGKMASKSCKNILLITASNEYDKYIKDEEHVEVVTSPCKTRFLSAVLWISVICNILAVLYISYKEVLMHGGAQTQKGHCTMPDKGSLCLPCSRKEQFSRTSGETRDVQWTTLCSDKNLCCLDSFEPFSRLIQIFSQDITEVETMRAGYNGRRPSAHVFIDVTLLKNDTLAWTLVDGYNTAFLVNGVQMVGATMQVPEEGYYFVYSFITFRSQPSLGTVNPSFILEHYVQRENPSLPSNGRQLLMMDRKSRPEGDFWFQSSFLSSVIRLRRHDRISTGVNNISSIYMATMSNFMGLYKI